MSDTSIQSVPLVDQSELQLTVGEPQGTVRGGVLVLHEAYGVSAAIRTLVAGLADEGWLTVAPHLHHHAGGPGSAAELPQHVEAEAARVSGASVLADSDVAFRWLADRGVASDHMGILGFDLGATAALVVATRRTLGAAVTVSARGVNESISEGLPPLVDVLGELTCPWLGLYGGDTDEVRSTDIEALRQTAHTSGRVVDIVVYPATEHRFDAASQATARPDAPFDDLSHDPARREARSRVLNWFASHLQ